jgi:hypothetical protein
MDFGINWNNFLIIGLVGQAFQMRKIRLTNYPDGELASPNIS